MPTNEDGKREQLHPIDVFRRVWQSGQPEHHPATLYQDKQLAGWYENFVYKLPSGEIVAVFENVTERKQAEEKANASLREKEVLLQEIHHRVKNNLQVIVSLLSLQAERTQDARALETLRDSQNRVRSMALIHEALYQSPNLAQVDFGSYVQRLAFYLFHLYKIDPAATRLRMDIKDVYLDIGAAIPCGLVINELMSNSFKYAFAEGDRAREVFVSLGVEGGRYVLKVGDNGVGLPAGLDFRSTDSLGLQLVKTLATHDLQGTIELDQSAGTQFTITFARKPD